MSRHGGNPGLTDEQCVEAYQTWKACDNNALEAAKVLTERHGKNISRSTLQNRLRRYDERKHLHEPEIEFPRFPDDDRPVEDIIDDLAERFEKRKASHEAHTWFPVKVKSDGPIGIMWWGDPHLDDNGCNWPLVKEYAQLCKATEGLYGANIGDTTNNWTGRLMRLYADQDTSLKTARRLAQWFMHDSGIRWLVWILGNHDQWGDGAAILAQMGRKYGTQKIVTHDWEARFRLVFPNKRECRIFAAHDFKGHSQWNVMHGPVKASKMGEEADLYVAGHKHTWGIHKEELSDRGGTFPTTLRVRGFKHMDDYARRLGFGDEIEGGAIMTIIDPHSKTRSGMIRVETDMHEGAEFLTWKRKRAGLK